MKLCINCEHYVGGYCHSPHQWEHNLVNGELVPTKTAVINADYQRSHGYFWARVTDSCGIEGRYYKEKL